MATLTLGRFLWGWRESMGPRTSVESVVAHADLTAARRQKIY